MLHILPGQQLEECGMTGKAGLLPQHCRTRLGALAAATMPVFTAAAATPSHAQPTTVVKAAGGQLRGEGTDIRVFRGIPYAVPPIGDLRWRPPQPAVPWQSPRDATVFGHDCPQPNHYPELRGSGQDEDCLTLNV
jgi:para-nitrobenzyl esterase